MQSFTVKTPGKKTVTVRYTLTHIVLIDLVKALGYKPSGAKNQWRNFRRDVDGFTQVVVDRLRMTPIGVNLQRIMQTTRKRAGAKILLPLLREHGLLVVDEPFVIVPRLQSTYVDAIIQAYGIEAIELEKPVGGKYRVDVYFKAWGFGLEIDEHGHSGYDAVKDAARTAAIPFHLIRINTDTVNPFQMIRVIEEYRAKTL